MKIYHKTILHLPILFICFSFLSTHAQVVLNEVMFNPSGSEFYDEYIELYNTGTTQVDLTGWRIGDGDGIDAIIAIANGLILAPKQYALILDANYFDNSTHYHPLPINALILTVDSPTLGNSGLSNTSNEKVVLISATGDTIASMTYQAPNGSGISEEKVDPLGGDDAHNWVDAKWPGGTPGRVNSVATKAVDLALPSGIIANVIAPWQKLGLFEVWVKNVGQETIHQFEVHLKGLPESVVTTGGMLTAGDSVRVTLYHDVVPGGVYQVSAEGFLEGDQDTTNQTTQWIVSGGYAPGTVVINEVMAAPRAGDEWIELYNVRDEDVNLSGWSVHDARSSAKIHSGVLSGKSLAVLSNESEEVMFSHPSRMPALNNGGDVLELRDATQTVIDQIAYPSATSDVSLERIDALAPGTDLSNWLDSTTGSTPGQHNSVKAVHVDTVSLVAQPNPFDVETRITYQLPVTRAHVDVWVFDRRGRKVRELLSASEGGARRDVVWDGRGDQGQVLKPGVFVLYLHARSGNGQVFQAKRPVVLTRGLND